MGWSHYQKAVFDFSENGKGNGCVEAVAGSGKSTTAIEMISRFSPMENGLLTTFTKVIIEDAQKKIAEKGLRNVKAQNYNSFGMGLIFKNMRPAPKLVAEKTDQILKFNVLENFEVNKDDEKSYYKCRYPIGRCVNLFKALAILNVSEAEKQYNEIVEYYDIEIPKDKRFKELLFATYETSLKRTDIIDFDDQKLFPLLFGWSVPQVDFLVVDEYQDSSPVEAELMLRACKNGRVIVFGDRNQAIYSFKGTKADSMQDFIEKFGAKQLPLSISYRCSQAVVREAQKIVPNIEYCEGAVEGAVNHVKRDEFRKRATDKDMILGRVTDDLVKSVLWFLGEGRAAYVVGREFGIQLQYFIEKIAQSDSMGITYFNDLLGAYFNEQHMELMKLGKESQAIMLESKYEAVSALLIGCQLVSDLKRKISSIFTDKGNGIRHMTIHKAKGLETSTDGDVFLLRPDKLPHPRAKKKHLREEEMRLKYVALTRAKRNFNYVLKEKDER